MTTRRPAGEVSASNRMAVGVAVPVAAGLVVGAVAWTVARSIGGDPRPTLWLGVPVVIVCLARLVVLSLGRSDPDVRPAVERDPARNYFAPLQVTVRQLEVSVREPGGYDRLVRPLLVDAVENRLAARHRVDAWTEPDRAREIMGADVWDATLGPPAATTRPPTAAQISALLTRIESM